MIPAEGFRPTLSKLVEALDHCRIRYHLTGGIVSRADAALSKLIWVHHGSHRSRRDLRRILAGATAHETGEVRRAAEEMGLATLLDEVLGERDEIDV